MNIGLIIIALVGGLSGGLATKNKICPQAKKQASRG